MKIPQLIAPWLLIVMTISACNGNRQGFRHPVLKKVHDQLELSCEEANSTYYKVVRDLTAETITPEDSMFALNDSCKLVVDLQYSFEQCFLEPSLLEYYDVKSSGDTTIATVKSGEEDEVDIQLEKIIFSDPDSTVRYLEVIMRKRQFLYDLDAHLFVEFGETGRYQRHQQIVDVTVSGGNHYFAETIGKTDRP